MNNIFAKASILWLTNKKLLAYSEQDSAAEHATEIRQYKPMDITPPELENNENFNKKYFKWGPVSSPMMILIQSFPIYNFNAWW